MIDIVINSDYADSIEEVVTSCDSPIMVTDPPFNIGYHYAGYHDSIPEDQYMSMLGGLAALCPSVFVLYPEMMHKLSIRIGRAPERIVSWVYPSNTARQHRDIGFYGISPDFTKVRVPYRNPNDKRIKELVKRTGGARCYDWMEVNQVKNVSREKTDHPCQMPLEVMRRIVGILPDDATIIDPFCGSGTTLVAAKLLGRHYVGFDIDAHYCDIACERLEAVTCVAAR